VPSRRAVAFAVSILALLLATSGNAATTARSGHVLHLVSGRTALHATQSSNWFGYQQSVLDRGDLIRQVGGTWVVPRATPRQVHQAEESSTWIGVGGGCMDSTCALSDKTLIQTGTESDVTSDGHAVYYAWYETIPEPSIRVPLSVRPGDRVTASIDAANGEFWTLHLRNKRTHASWTKTIPYVSSFGTAEWIVETPLLLGLRGGLATLPRLNRVHFDRATVNGVNPRFNAAQAVDLVDNNTVIGVPSAPQRDGNGFGACAYARTCAVPKNF
jgi:hypothetical protein